MRNLNFFKTHEEVKKKLKELYPEPLPSERNVLDFDREYDFFSDNELFMVKYSSKWFNPDKYDQQLIRERKKSRQNDDIFNQVCKVYYENGNGGKNSLKKESDWKLGGMGCCAGQPTRDLEKLGRTSYHIGIEGEKFRVVAATLQKCNSPFIRRTFQFTSNGIIETPETRNDSEQNKTFPSMDETGKRDVFPKLVTIRKFRVIKKDNLPGQKSFLPQINLTNGEKPRFLTVQIRSKKRKMTVDVPSSAPEVIPLTSSTEEEDFDDNEKPPSPYEQTEETDDGEEPIMKQIIAEEHVGYEEDPEKYHRPKEVEKLEEKVLDNASVNHTDSRKRFPTGGSRNYSCLQPQQRPFRELCSKKFLTTKLLRDHVGMSHPYQRCSRNGGGTEDRIKTATSKFGRTRRVLNIAGLRSKYKML